MEFKQISVPTIKEVFIQTMESKILSNEIPIGTKLPSERELSNMMQISKTIVHDGLKELERLGFVTAFSGKGTFVANYIETGSVETLLSIIKYQNNNLDSLTHTSMIEMRLALEPAAMIMFTESVSDEDLSQLDAYMQNVHQCATETASAFSVADALFTYHHFLYVKCGNNVLPLICNVFKELAVLSITKFLNDYGMDASLQWLDAIHHQLMQRQGEKAAALLKENVFQYGRQVKVPVHDIFMPNTNSPL